MGGGTQSSFKVRVDDEKFQQGITAARREMRKREKQATIRAGEKTILPKALALTPSFLKPGLKVRADWHGGMLTMLGKRTIKRAAGLLNFGGVRRDQLRPRKGGAMVINGSPVKAVLAPRVYRAKHFLEKGVSSGIDEFGEEYKIALLDAFADQGMQTS